jgi:hypothetical protein
MGGERASSVRRRREGKICCSCGSSLPPPHVFGERYCVRCLEAKGPRHRVYLHFMLREGWHCQFLEEELETPLPRKLTFADVSKVRELAEKGGGFNVLEGRHSFNQGVEVGRGGIYLQLTEEQYQKLKRG